jgi:predicted DNA-binding ribbon-helix-helix protein
MAEVAVEVHGQQTSLSLEPDFIDGLYTIAAYHQCSMNTIVERLADQGHQNLSAAVRELVLQFFLEDKGVSRQVRRAARRRS